MRPFWVLAAALAFIAALVFADSAAAAVLPVTSLTDPGDGVCDATCTLRDAILASNASTGTRDDITFTVSGAILPATPLPALTDPVDIDGTTAPGFTTGAPTLELDGSSLGASDFGLQLSAGQSLVLGLTIDSFGVGVVIDSDANQVYGNLIGTDAFNSQTRGNKGSGVSLGGANNVVGGASPGQRNVISGNGFAAVQGSGVGLGGT